MLRVDQQAINIENLLLERRVIGPDFWTPDMLGDITHDQRGGERADQMGRKIAISHRLVDDLVEADAENSANDDSADQGCPEWQPEQCTQRQRDKPTKHQELALRKIHDVDGINDQNETESDQSIDRADGEGPGLIAASRWFACALKAGRAPVLEKGRKAQGHSLPSRRNV